MEDVLVARLWSEERDGKSIVYFAVYTRSQDGVETIMFHNTWPYRKRRFAVCEFMNYLESFPNAIPENFLINIG